MHLPRTADEQVDYGRDNAERILMLCIEPVYVDDITIYSEKELKRIFTLCNVMTSQIVDDLVTSAKAKSISSDELKERFFVGFKSGYQGEIDFFDAIGAIESSSEDAIKAMEHEQFRDAQEYYGSAVGYALALFSKADSMQRKAKENLDSDETLDDYYDKLLRQQGTKSPFDVNDAPFELLGKMLQVYETTFDVDINPFDRIEQRLVGHIKQHGELDDSFERYLKTCLDSLESGYNQ